VLEIGGERDLALESFDRHASGEIGWKHLYHHPALEPQLASEK
jgi:hypothetical protein